MARPTASAALARFVVSAPACAHPCGRERGSAECTYQVAWAINPHMRVGAAEPRRAVRQHDAFVRMLAELGACVDRVPFVHGAYDSVFMKDSAILAHRDGRDVALLARPLHPERRAEQRARALALEARRFEVLPAPETPLEGGDVVVHPNGRVAFLGHGFRSARASAAALERALGMRVVPLELVDPELYHLDMALTITSDGAALVCAEAFTPHGIVAIASETAELVPVPVVDAHRFALNLVQVGDAVVMGGEHPSVAAQLRARGLATHATPLREFHHAGGSAACLVARVHGYERVATSETAAMRSTAA